MVGIFGLFLDLSDLFYVDKTEINMLELLKKHLTFRHIIYEADKHKVLLLGTCITMVIYESHYNSKTDNQQNYIREFIKIH